MPRYAPTLADYYAENKPVVGDAIADDMGGPAGRVHDWRNYVGEVAEYWPTLSVETRMAVALIADAAASREDWE